MRNWTAAALAVCLFVVAPAAAQQHQAEPGAEAALSPAEARRDDIAAFRTLFMARDQSYAPAARAEAEARLARLEADADRVSQAYFELEIGRIVALANNGHSNDFPGPRSRRFDRVAVRFVPFGEEFFILRADAANADLLGARLVAIDGHAIAQLRAASRSLIGGTPAWRDRNAGYLFESPEQLHALGLAARAGQARYRLALLNGRTVTRTLAAEPANPDRLRANADRWLCPEPMQGEGADWRSLLALADAPWALRDPDTPFRMRDAPELDAFVIELRQNNNAEDRELADFLIESVLAVNNAKRANIVLDMRMNGGGDLNYTRAWVRRLPQLIPGRVFVLTSPWTFSAGISTIGYLKQSAPDRVVIVGEAVGDRLDFYAEGTTVTLPHSGALISFAMERHDYVTGCRGIENCHGSVVRFPIAVPSLAPDIAAPWTIDAYREGRDPAIDAVAAALAQGR